MIGTQVTFTPTQRSKLDDAIARANAGSLSSAAFVVRQYGVRSIKRRKNKDVASPPGTPPFTHEGFYRRAVWYDVDKQRMDAVIGFRFSVIGTIASTHEFGKTEEGRRYPQRPTIRPALEAALGEIAGKWRGTIGG